VEISRAAGADHLDGLPPSADDAPGLSVLSLPAVDIVGVELRFFTVLENCSRVGTAAAWPMKASKNPWACAVLERRRRSECNWGEPEQVRTVSRQAERMHWRTYDRLLRAHDVADARSMMGMMRFVDRVQRRAPARGRR
jgi:hypothetical protein